VLRQMSSNDNGYRYVIGSLQFFYMQIQAVCMHYSLLENLQKEHWLQLGYEKIIPWASPVAVE
jgi:hypothetical protein